MVNSVSDACMHLVFNCFSEDTLVLFIFQDRLSLSHPGYPGTHYEVQATYELGILACKFLWNWWLLKGEKLP